MDKLRQIKYEPAGINGGYTDRVLIANLDKLEFTIEELPPDFKHKYIGGRGYALKYIWDRTTRETTSDSPDNLLVMASGPLGNETGFPGTGKFVVGTISPLTETFVDSNIGGHFGPLLKLAGFDALVITGKSSKAVVILINGDTQSISIETAPSFDEETDTGSLSYGNRLLEEINGGEYVDTIAAVTTGKGADNTRYGVINSLYYDRRRNRIRAKQAGRGGTGTVMRAKNLLGIVVRSSLPKINANNAVDRKGVREAGSKLKAVIAESDPKQLNLSAWGTTILTEYMDRFHILPVNNYQYGQSPDSPKIFANVFLDKFFSKNVPDGCYYGCNLACSKGTEDFTLTRGPFAGRKVGIDAPEYETVAAISNMGIFDPHFVMEYSWYCDEYGLDTISTGVSIGFFIECFERGFLDISDTGYALSFNNPDMVERLLLEIAGGKGFGKTVGQGVARGKKWVAERHASRNGISYDSILEELNKFGMEVKGLEFSMYICKESLAQQGGYGFALKGPQHDESWLIFIDQVHKELPTLEKKADACKWFPLVRTWFNATGLCKLPWIDVRNPEAAATDDPSKNLPTLAYYVDYLNATTGSSKTMEDMLADSERLYILQKLVNLRHGRGVRANDRLPLRAMGPAYLNEYEFRAEYYDEWLREHLGNGHLPDSPQERHSLLMEKRVEAYQQLCDIVYEKKGFSSEGIPKRATVEKFDLMDEQANRLLEEFGV